MKLKKTFYTIISGIIGGMARRISYLLLSNRSLAIKAYKIFSRRK